MLSPVAVTVCLALFDSASDSQADYALHRQCHQEAGDLDMLRAVDHWFGPWERRPDLAYAN